MTSLLVLLLLSGDLAGAEKALAEGEPQKALELLGDLADSDDADLRAVVVQGRALYRLKEYAAAVEPLIRASDARPQDEELAREATYACWYSARGMYAKLFLEDARRLAKRTGDALLAANIDYAYGDYEAALEGYCSVETTDANRLAMLMRIADCRQRLGQENESLAAYADALEEALRVEDLATAYHAARLAKRRGRLLSWLDERIAAQPESVVLRRYRGYARVDALMYEEAIDDLRFVAEREPSVALLNRLALALVQYGVRKQDPAFVRESERRSVEVLDQDPRNQDAWTRLSWLAWHYWTQGDVERSYAVLKDLRKRDPEDVLTGLNFAGMARRLGHYDEARSVLEGLLALNPDDARVLNDLGIVMDGLGERARAVELWEQTLEAEPENLNALENLFTHHWERGNGATARDYLKRGLSAARAQKGPVWRWLWFLDRLSWAPSGFGE